MNEIETDYLIVGAGASAMAFVDSLITETDADVVMLDRHHAPGGHWLDAYPFVRIHQASATYGVNSRPLGRETIDTTGHNAGLYECTNALEICNYFERVMEETLLPSGQVRFFCKTDYVGNWENEHAFVSLISGKRSRVRVRKRIVDTTHLRVTVPATHTPGFSVDSDVRFMPVGGLVDINEAPSGYNIIGGGKTAMDAVIWLLEQGEDPERIQWIRPRDSWLNDRKTLQPLDLVTNSVEGFSWCIEAVAQATSVDDLFDRVVAKKQLFPMSDAVKPTMYKGAILNDYERDQLKRIERIVRQGRVRHIGSERVLMEQGELPTDSNQVHVDCSASGFRSAPLVPIFQPGKMVLQSLIGGFTTYNAALVAFIESTARSDEEKNRLCPPVAQIVAPLDWIRMIRGVMQSSMLHAPEEDISEWQSQARLNLTKDLGKHLDEPRMQAALDRWQEHTEGALQNSERLLTAG